MVLAFKGRKSSSSSKKATRHDDNLFGTDTVEALLALGEGPIKGWKRGAADFFVGDVPLLDAASSTPNISNFELRLLKGTDPADSIKLNLGGTASTKNVGLELRTPGQMINVQGDKTQIDFIDFRFVVQRLLSANDEGGEFATDLSFKIEVKRRSSSQWVVPFTNEIPPDENTSGASSYRPGVTTPGSVVNGAYRETYIQADAPIAGKAVGAMWFNTNLGNWRPSIWDGHAWVVPNSLTAISQFGMPTWRWVDFDGAIRTAWYSPDGAAPPPGGLAAGDFLLTPQAGEQVYSYNDTAWVGFQSWASPSVVAPGVIHFNGLTRSSYPKEFRVPVPRINEPYDVRVTRITAATTKNVFADLTFESIQEVNRDPVAYPNLAIAWLTIKATDTFTSIPEFTSIAQGLIIPVPTNCTFNEETKLDEYVGLWDGSFKMAYTNSPAWHAYNFIMNARYGKNSYYPEVADKWDFYGFARHCALHSLRFNEYITEARPLNELINYIVGIAGGRYIDRGDGYSSVLWDADDQPAVAIFAPENTIEGAFTYSFTDVTERKNDFKVSFKNPELNYREDRLRVYDQNSIDVYGRNAEEFVAVGCRDAEEAVRRGRLRLATSLTECIIVNFKTNRLGRYLTPFQVILVADDQSTNVITGRVLNTEALPAGTVTLPLRDQIYLEAGVDYSVSFTLSDGNGGLRVVTYPLAVSSPGQQSVLKLARALTDPLPEFAVFSIGTPKAFRVTSIVEADDDKDNIDITAIEVNRQKWAFVDGKVELRDILAVQTGPLSKYVYPVSNARIFPEITLDGHYNLVVAWNPSETKLIRGYRLYQSINNGPMNLLAEPSDSRYVIADAVAGTYVISIVAVGLDGTTESPPVTVQYIVSNTGSLRSVAPPTNLRLVDEPNSPVFQAVNPVFAWDAAADALVSRYLVEIVGVGGVVHTERTTDLGFTYSLIANRADNGGTPLRQFTIRVRSIDSTGNLSAPASLTASHPPPPAVIPTLSSAFSTIIVTYDPNVPDYQGALTFIETSPIPVPPATAPKADTKNPTVTYTGKDGVLYHIRVALYDSYGKTGLNYSNDLTIQAREYIVDTTAPSIPEAPTVSTSLVVGDGGALSASARTVWKANPSSNFGSYLVRARLRGAGDWTVNPAGKDQLAYTYENLPLNTLIEVQVAAVNALGTAVSGWSPTGSARTPASTVAPDPVTNFSVTATTLAAYVRWQNPANKDLGWIEIYAGSTNDRSAATLVATIAAPGTTWQDPTLGTTGARFYWARAFNTSGLGSVLTAGPVQATSLLIVAGQLQADVVTSSLEAQNLEALGRVTTSFPPVANYKGPSTLTYQGKLYTIQNGAWQVISARANAADIVGQVTADQILNIRAAQLTGQITKTQIGDKQIDTPQINVGAVRAANIAAGEIMASHLLIASTNLIYNANGKILKANKYQSGVTTDPGPSNASLWDGSRTDNTFPGTTPFLLRPPTNNPTAGSYGQICFRRPIETTDSPYKAHNQVVAGQRYELSVYLATYDCNGQIYADAYDDAGNYKGRAYTSASANSEHPNGLPVRRGGFFDAPPGATNIGINVIGYWTGGTNPHLFASAPMLAPCDTRQTELSPFVADGFTKVDGGSLVTGTVTARTLNAVEVFADTVVANAAKLAVLTVGSIKADQIAAGAVVADKLGIGLNTGNLIWNSDFGVEGWMGWDGNGETLTEVAYNTTWSVSGMKAFYIACAGTSSGRFPYFEYNFPTGRAATQANPNDHRANTLPIQGGKTYEFSVYLSVHRMSAVCVCYWIDANGGIIKQTEGQYLTTNYASGAPSDSWRSRQIAKAPDNAVRVLLRIVGLTNGQGGGSSSYVFASAPYFGVVPDGTKEHQSTDGPNGVYSAYAPQSATTITGGQIATRSLQASDKITAGSMSTDLFTVGTIDAKILNVDTLYAQIVNSKVINTDRVIVGNTGDQTLSSVINGGSWVKIEGGALAANSITANLIRIGSRGIQTVDIEFYIERNGDGNLTNVMAWTAGYVLYIGTDNVQRSSYVPAGRVGIDAGYWYIWWCLRTPNAGFYSGKDNEAAIRADQDNVLMASVAGVTGLSVFGGAGFLVDGDRVTARSIRANNIAVGSLSADLIQANTIFTQQIFLGLKSGYGGALVLDGPNQRIYFNDWANQQTRMVLGNVSPWYGNDRNNLPKTGMILWDEDGNVIFGSSSGINAGKLFGSAPAGSIPTGAGANSLPNAGFGLGAAYYGWANNNTYMPVSSAGIDKDGYEYSLEGGHTLGISSGQQGGCGADCIIDVYAYSGDGGQGYANAGNKYPVIGGQMYELSAYMNCHRCDAYVIIVWYDGNGNYLTESQGNRIVNRGQGGRQLWQYARSGVIARAPDAAAYALPHFRMQGNGGNTPYMWFTQPLFGPAREGQTELSPWNPGSNSLAITGTNISTYIRGAIIDTAYIAYAAIKSAQIGDLEVNNAKIANLTVGNGKIANYAVTNFASATSLGDGTNGANTAYAEIPLRSGKFLITVWMRGGGATTRLSQGNIDPGTLAIKCQYGGSGLFDVERLVVPITQVYLPSNGGNHFYCPAFGYSIVWDARGANYYGFQAAYEGSLYNNGVGIFIMELSK